jgi:hypothetical protein
MPIMSSLPARDGVARGGHIGDAGGVERRQSNFGADAAGKIEVRCGLHALHRDHVGHRRIGVDLAPDDIEKIDLARRLEHVADGNAFFFVDPALCRFIGGVADADEQLFSHPDAGSQPPHQARSGRGFRDCRHRVRRAHW